MSEFVIITLVALFSFILTILIRKLALKKSILDIPNERSSHTVPTPRGGGMAIVVAWYLGISWLFFNQEISSQLFFAFLSGLILVIVSLIDDMINLQPKIRMAAQSLSAGMALYFLGGLTSIDLGFYQFENLYILTPIAFITFIWFINLYNFLDGIDGYAAMEVIFFSVFMYLLSPNPFLLILTFASLGFLFWNWHPAKIFMGDVGSTLLGFNIIVIAIYFQNQAEISIIIPIIITAVFWFDATLTLFRRYRNKEKLTRAHRKHAYQRAVQSGYSHSKVTLAALIINIVLGLLAYIAYEYCYALLPGLIISIILLYAIVKLIDKRKAFECFKKT